VMGKPLAIDLFSGLFGWSAGLVQEGWRTVGIDLEDMHDNFGLKRPREFGLIIQDVLTVDGHAFSGADLIVASPPCQFFSYVAMPWSRGKALAAKVRADPVLLEKELALFNACFRIQREASAAAKRHIPMVVENVRGAEAWVGRARWGFGSFMLWGDVPALMPTTFKARKLAGFRFDGSGRSFQSASVEHTGVKAPGMNWSDRTKGERLSFTDIASRHAFSGQKGVGPKWDAQKGSGAHGVARWTNPAEGRKGAGAGAEWFDQNLCQLPSKSPRRKAASALIAKIPETLSRHIGRVYFPRG
jgi:hypothetical protein